MLGGYTRKYRQILNTMDTITRTFPLGLTSTATSTIIELCHFRDMIFDADERIGIYLEAFFCNMSLKSFNLGIYPDFDGGESEAEKMAKFNASENKSQKLGLRILTKKNNTGDWREKAEVILVNRGRKDYFDLLIPYLAKVQVRLLEKNDAIGVQLVDYGNGLLKTNDFIEIEVALRIEISKKNDLQALTSRIAALELALEGKLINLPANTLLGRNTGAGTVEQIPATRFATPAMIDQAIIDLVGGASGALNTLVELAAALNNDNNFSATIASNLAAINSRISIIESKKSVVISTPLNIAANTWFTVGQIDAVGFASIEALYACAVYVQYGDGTNTVGYWQYNGGGVISSIQWKAGGVQLATSFKMEAHNSNDFNCSVRFTLSSVNRTIQVMFDTPIVTQSPSVLRVTLKRII